MLEQMALDNLNFRKRYYQSMLGPVVDAAVRITGADMGNLQLFDPASNSLRIHAQRGFSDDFLKFFDCVHGGQAACGTAVKSRRRVIVRDVAESPIFCGATALEVLLDAGARAVQSTPLIGPSGSLLGAISTHWASPYRPCSKDLSSLDLLVLTTAAWLENRLPSIRLDGLFPDSLSERNELR
jgi:GAF domain-containing protein